MLLGSKSLVRVEDQGHAQRPGQSAVTFECQTGDGVAMPIADAGEHPSRQITRQNQKHLHRQTAFVVEQRGQVRPNRSRSVGQGAIGAEVVPNNDLRRHEFDRVNPGRTSVRRCHEQRNGPFKRNGH
jgi:hypothetical protein